MDLSETKNKYVGIKYVEAMPMNAERAKEKGYKVNGSEDGYEVVYDDGYKSWCPKDVFERNNTLLTKNCLAYTAGMMVSKDYKERFIAEYQQTKIRYEKLKAVCNKIELTEQTGKDYAGFKNDVPVELLKEQQAYMGMYLDVLEKRAIIENFDLQF